MQTFLPYPDFVKSAKVLDYRRLGKQRVECLQLLRGQFPNHPISKMWRGYEYQLAKYGLIICRVWINKGYRDTCRFKIIEEQKRFVDTGLPKWFGNEEFHRSHRSKLLSKDIQFYRNRFPDDEPGLPYIWPI